MENDLLQKINNPALIKRAKRILKEFAIEIIWDGQLLRGSLSKAGQLPFVCQVSIPFETISCSCSQKICEHQIALYLKWCQNNDNIKELTSNKISPKEIVQKKNRWQTIWDEAEIAITDLELWLGDILKHGIIAFQLEDEIIWKQISILLANHKCTGLSQRLLFFFNTHKGTKGWADHCLIFISQLFFTVQSYRKFNSQGKIHKGLLLFLGRSIQKNDLSPDEIVQVLELKLISSFSRWVDDQMEEKNNWLMDCNGNFYLQKSYSIGSQQHSLIEKVNELLTVQFLSYAKNISYRIAILEHSKSMFNNFISKTMDMKAMIHSYEEKLKSNPWLDHFPCLLEIHSFLQDQDIFYVADLFGHAIPCINTEKEIQRLTVQLKKGSQSVFAVYDGYVLHLQSLYLEGQFYSLFFI
jgi:hypothetical protein